MVIVSQAGNYRLVAYFGENTLQLLLEEKKDGEWVKSDDGQVYTIGAMDFWKLSDEADKAWKDYWG